MSQQRSLPGAFVSLLLASVASAQAFCYPDVAPYTLDGAAFAAELVDFDSDGDLDVAAGVSGESGALRLLLNDGTGALSDAGVIPCGANVLDVLAFDADSDGDADLAAADAHLERVHVLIGDGAGGFAPGPELAGGIYPYALGAADVDEDGVLDLLCANHFSDDVSLWRGGPGGAFAPVVSLAAGPGCNGLALLDLDQDGHVDAVVSNRHADEIRVLRGDGAGGFTAEPPIAAGQGPIGVAAGDLDRDGLPDVVVASHLSDSIACFLNDGSGGLALAAVLAAEDQPEVPVLADLDGDHVLDLAVENSMSDSLGLYRGNGDGTFEPAAILPAGDRPHGLCAGDLDGDPWADLVAAHLDSGEVTIHLSACPTVDAISATSAQSPGVIQVTGGGLQHVVAATIGGAPASIVAQGEGALDLVLAGPHAPGFFAVALSAFGASFDAVADAELRPSLSAAAAPGEVALEIDHGAPGIWILAYGNAPLAAPLALPSIGHGLLLDPSQVCVVLDDGLLLTEQAVSVHLGTAGCAASFTNAVAFAID